MTRADGDRARPKVSFLLATYNRRAITLDTLAHVARCGLPAGAFETLVVDNASEDGTAAAIREAAPHVRLFALGENRGPTAKNVALAEARGDYVVFLDDDSYPLPGATERMIAHFEGDARLGAAVFTVTLPDGTRECSAYPDVFIGCGTGFRKRALDEVGGLPDDFFMQAEEYDLSLRLLDGGWDVRRCDDLEVVHLKSPGARIGSRTTRLDVRNNLVLAARRFPARWVVPFAYDWTRRYFVLASARGHRAAWARGVVEGLARAARVDWRRPVGDAAFERFTRLDETEARMRDAVRARGLRRVLFVDFGKSILGFWRAARAAGVDVVAIADARIGGRGWRYRGVPIVGDDDARALAFDAAIVSNLSPVHAAARRDAWRARDRRPVVDLFEEV